MIHRASDERNESRRDRTDTGEDSVDFGLPSPFCRAGWRMELRLSRDGKPSVSWFLLSPALFFSLLAVLVSCHGSCKHRVPSPNEIVHHVYLKPERLTKRSSPEDLQLKIKIIYDSSVDQLTADKRRLVKDKLFPQAIAYLQRAFSVRRRVGPVLLSRKNETTMTSPSGFGILPFEDTTLAFCCLPCRFLGSVIKFGSECKVLSSQLTNTWSETCIHKLCGCNGQTQIADNW